MNPSRQLHFPQFASLQRAAQASLEWFEATERYMDLDPTVVRIGFVLLALLSGTGIVLYIILALIMPAPETV